MRCLAISGTFVYIEKDSLQTTMSYKKSLVRVVLWYQSWCRICMGKGYHLYVNNWYKSEKPLDHLDQNRTTACGIARSNRPKVPPSLKKQEMKKGDHDFCRNENLLMVRYKDKKKIYFLDTIHEVKMERDFKRGQEDPSGSNLLLVNDYNKYVGASDRNILWPATIRVYVRHINGQQKL